MKTNISIFTLSFLFLTAAHAVAANDNDQQGSAQAKGSKQGYFQEMGQMDEHMMDYRQESQVADKAQVKEINLEAFQFAFSPESITVKKGDVVKIHATSRDVPHGVFIKEYGINEKVEKGKTTDIEFVADKAGEFDILCSVYCGRGHRDMKAKFIVKER